MKVFLTGGTGMVGRNVLDHLPIANIEIASPKRSVVDLLDYKTVIDFVSEYQPDLIIHCAGLVGGIQANVKSNERFLSDNIRMGINVVDAAAKTGVRKLINLGSSCMYPTGISGLLSEDKLYSGTLEPTNEGYALAKIVVSKYCSYISQKNSSLRFKTLVPCNLYGRYDNFSPEKSHLVPAIIEKLHTAMVNEVPTVEIWGDGTARREFMLASDLANAIWYMVENFDTFPETVNVGTGLDFSVLEYYQMVAEIVGYLGEFKFNTNKPTGMKRKLLDTSLMTALGWTCGTPVKQGLSLAYKHYLENYNVQTF